MYVSVGVDAAAAVAPVSSRAVVKRILASFLSFLFFPSLFFYCERNVTCRGVA
jgi:hypothetical protein